MKRSLIIPGEKAEYIKKLLSTEPACERDCLDPDAPIVFTVPFENNVEIDIKVCGVVYREGESNKPWTEAVLFKNGNECKVQANPDDVFFKTWSIEYEKEIYEVEITT